MSPDGFWSLTVREFWIKHAAFARAEDRAESLTMQLALLTTSYKDQHKKKLEKRMHALRRYPVKPWLKGD